MSQHDGAGKETTEIADSSITMQQLYTREDVSMTKKREVLIILEIFARSLPAGSSFMMENSPESIERKVKNFQPPFLCSGNQVKKASNKFTVDASPDHSVVLEVLTLHVPYVVLFGSYMSEQVGALLSHC